MEPAISGFVLAHSQRIVRALELRCVDGVLWVSERAYFVPGRAYGIILSGYLSAVDDKKSGRLL